MNLCYAIVDTAFGWVGIVGSSKGLRRLSLPHREVETVRASLGPDIVQAVADLPFFEDLPERLERYFEGRRIRFADGLDLDWATPFQRAVWGAARGIPYGETRSYGWVAGQVDRQGAARAVGQAMARNPLPIVVPCHRVVGGDGSLGGFGGGLDLKRRLLALESSGDG